MKYVYLNICCICQCWKLCTMYYVHVWNKKCSVLFCLNLNVCFFSKITFSHVCMLITMYWKVPNYWFCVFSFFSIYYLCYDYELCMRNVEINFCSDMLTVDRLTNIRAIPIATPAMTIRWSFTKVYRLSLQGWK